MKFSSWRGFPLFLGTTRAEEGGAAKQEGISHDKTRKEGHTLTLAEQEALVGEVAGEFRSCRVSRSEGEGEEWVRGLDEC